MREQGHSPEAFAQWLGERFAPAWDGVRGDLEQVAYYMALNPVSLGAELRGYEVGEDEATIQVTLPPRAKERVSRAEDATLFNEFFRQPMEHLDLNFEWEQEGDVITYHVQRRARG